MSSERTKIKDLENSKNTNIDNLEKKIVDIQMSMKLQLTQKDKLLDATEERLSELKREKEEYQNKVCIFSFYHSRNYEYNFQHVYKLCATVVRGSELKQTI